ncbi:MAG: DNA mismatch repair protein MutS [Caldimicrobium sp.]
MRGKPQSELTPMFRQYMDIKSKYPDCILFFRLGDFYEMFFEDAETVAPLLGLVLTKREAGKNLTAPMCGIPVERCDFYIHKLIELGFKVAICEQLEDPSLAKGLVKRDVVKIFTPGLFIDLSYLKDKEKIYLGSLVLGKNVALSFLELSCGEFLYTYLPQEKILTEIIKREPKELLVEDSYKEASFLTHLQQALPHLHITFLEKSAFTQYKKNFTLEEVPEEVLSALSAIYYYINLYQPHLVDKLSSPEFFYPEEYLYIDEKTKDHLELVRNLWDKSEKYSLYWVLDKTKTPMGSRLLKEWILYPLRDLKAIRERQRVIEFFLEKREKREKLGKILIKVSDLERLGNRLALQIINPKELALLRESLKNLPPIISLLQELKTFINYPPYLAQIEKELSPLENLYELLERALVEDPPHTLKEGGIFKKGYHSEIDTLRDLRENALVYLSNLEAELKRKTGIPTLKIGYNRVFGYYVEISKSYLKYVPSYFERRQTLANAERYTLKELKELEEKILSAEEKLKNIEYEVFGELRKELSKEADKVKRVAKALATLDVLLGLAEVAEKYNYVCPEITEEKVLIIEEGRHPVLERILGEEKFIPNSLELKENESEFLIITGPNMGGKSTYLRQTALIAILAHMGSFVPAKSAKIGLLDKIFTRIGAGDELIRGRSTFMVEMSECARILKEATERSLILLDEVGRGTSTFDGLSIAWAIAEYLYKKRIFTLLATHYFELTELAKEYPGIRNYHAEVREWADEVIFLYRILPGAASQSYGIEVAKLAKLPEEVLTRAKEILQRLEQKKPKITKKQLTLFTEDAKIYLLDKIKKIDPDTLSPKEALEFLYQLKKELKDL